MGATTDGAGLVQVFEDLYVVDASIMRTPLRASPNLTVMTLAERTAELLADRRMP
jgi:choline dehydrogenase-like flavoprotein